MMNTKKSKTFVELEGKLDHLMQSELAKVAGGEQSSPASDINPYIPPPPPTPVH
jgi:hypothetical protein